MTFREENISAEKAAPQEGAWLPQAYGYREWPEGSRSPPGKGSRKAYLLINKKVKGPQRFVALFHYVLNSFTDISREYNQG